MVEVTQADRDAVKSIYPESIIKIASSGYFDDDPLVQAIARHRLATEATKDAEIASQRAEIAELVALLRDAREDMIETSCLVGIPAWQKNTTDILHNIEAALAKHGGCDE